ncbi:Bax inhibitor-1/YccA family protein [Pseudomonas fluorescens]|uniref:Bax inhibitor-1/YccA family protein n=1 Tax=Pseudomonas TaxID=286 RepID=UPI000F0326D6|nr:MULTISPECIES: Bax inhibitor-1/YccA family protein [Pseudomonas]MBD8088636.1 Bax inhibitor-1/YccA family protein [Pseudomonas fluorescens]MBD8681413.1 Bax inhibitor-1/YccA family protein [Pseudomonas sp. CFBP 13719]
MSRVEDQGLLRPAADVTSRVLRQTYQLLAATLAVSGITAFVSQSMGLAHPGLLLTLVGFYGILFMIHKKQNSGSAIAWTFGLAAFMGYTLGPLLNKYLSLPNGGTIIGNAFMLTAFTFAGLSAYVLRSQRDMKFLEGFLVAGFFVLVGSVVLSLFVDIPGLTMAISAGFVLFSCAAILYETSEIIKGGQTNYVLATVSLFISIYNLFVSLLSLMGLASKD